eukprot:GHVH01012339.1.p1 GENE.GHVH01012339.1~~GHVH01012339.1.p1  ORF type:complete len:454 (-),score=74.03 GHVH01012339.1:30-1391(-)
MNGEHKMIDLRVKAKWIIPVTESVGPLKTIKDGCLGVDNGIIVFVGTNASFDGLFRAKKTITKSESSVLVPGFVNLHTHLGMHLLKGKFDDQKLMDWLHSIWPMEKYFLSDPERKRMWTYYGSLLACRESVLEGTTTLHDMYPCPDQALLAGNEVGVRVLGAYAILDTNDGTIQNQLDEEKRFIDAGISYSLSLHSMYTTNDYVHDQFKQWKMEYPDKPVHIHIYETSGEREMQQNSYGMSCFDKLEQLGCLDDKLIAAHMVHLTDEEIERCGKKRVNVAHCPRSNLKLASGLAQTAKMIRAGLNVGLGTDSSCSNNQLSMLDEMTAACFVGKVAANSADSITADDALRMATINGAKALKLDHLIGSLEVGKEADFCVVELNDGDHFFPITSRPLSYLVYTSRRSVTDVFKGGNHLVEDSKCISFNLDKKIIVDLMTELDKQIEGSENVNSCV